MSDFLGWCAWYGNVTGRRIDGILWAVAGIWLENVCRVCLLGGRLDVPRSSSIESTLRPSLLSDCTSGLVGCLYTKLEEREEDNEDSDDLYVSARSGNGICVSNNLNEANPLGGDVANQEDCWSGLKISLSGSMVLFGLVGPLGPLCWLDDASWVKSPLCRADLGRSIRNPCSSCSVVSMA